MNTRVRVQAIPAITAAAIGLSPIGRLLAIQAPVSASGANQPTGFDEINLSIDENGITGMPETLAAGRYLVRVTGPNSADPGQASGVVFVQFPNGMTAEEAFEDEQQAMITETWPTWWEEAHYAGGVKIRENNEYWVILDFTPGTWHVSELDVSAPSLPFEVTGDFPQDVADPGVNVEVELIDLDFKVTAGAFVAGENVVTTHNTGAEHHHLTMYTVPDGTTEEQAAAMYRFFDTGTPEEDMLDPDSRTQVFNTIEQSTGTSMTFAVSMESGTYLFTCWVPNLETERSHAQDGMIEIIVVE